MWPAYAFHVPEQKKLRYIVHTYARLQINFGEPRRP